MASPVDTRTKERPYVPFARDPIAFYSTPDGARTDSGNDGAQAVTGKCTFERIDDAIEARIKKPTFAFTGNAALTKQASDLMYKGKKVGFNLPSLLKLAKFYQTNKKSRAALHYYRRAFRHIVAVNSKFDRNKVPPLEHRRELEGIAKELRAIDPYYAGQVYQFLLTRRDERYSPGTAGLRNFRWKGPRAYSVSRANHRSLLNERMGVPKRLKYARLWAESAKASGDIIGMREPLGILKDSGIKDAISKKESAWLTRMSAFDGGRLKDIKSKDLISIVQSYWNAGLVDHARAAYQYLISVEGTRTPDGKLADWKNSNLLPNLEKPLETARTLAEDRLHAVQRELLAGKLSTAETIELSQEQRALKATLKLAKRVGDETADGLFTYADAGELCKTVQTRLLMGVLSGNAEVYEDAQRDVQFMLKAAQSNRRVFMYRALHLANLHPEMAKAVRLGDAGAIFASYGSGTKGSMHPDFPHEKNINELPIVKVFAALKKRDPEKAARLQKSLNALFSHELTLARDKNTNRVTVTDMGKLRLLHANQESRSALSRIDWKLLGQFFKNVQGRTLRTDGAKTTVRVKGMADAFSTIDRIEFVLRNPALLKGGKGFYKKLDRIAYQLSKLHKKHSPGRHVDIIKHIAVSRPYAYLTAYVGVVRKALNQEMFRVMKPEILALGKLKGVSTKKLFEKLHAAERAPSAEKTKLYKALLSEVNWVRTDGVIDTLVADLKRFKGADKRVENEEYWLYRQMNNVGRLAAGRTKNEYSDCTFGPLISQLVSIKSKLASPVTRAAAQQEFAILMRGASLHNARASGMKALKSDRSVVFWNTLFTELGKTLAAIVVSQGIGLVARAGSLVGLMRMGVSARRANLLSKMIGFGAGVAGFSETDMLLHGQEHDFSLGYKNGRIVVGKTYALYAQHATMFAMLGGAVKGYMWRLRQKGIKFAELGLLGKAKHGSVIFGAEYGALTAHEGMWHGKVNLLCLNRATMLLMFKASGFIVKPFVKPFMKAAEGMGRRYQEHVVRMYKEMPQLAEDVNRISPDLSPREQKAVLRRQKKALNRYKRYMEAMEAAGSSDYSLVTKLIGEIDTHIGRIDAQSKIFNSKSRARVQDASNIAPNTFTYVRGNRGRNGNYRNQEALARELEKHPDVKRAQEKHPQMKVRAHADGRVTAPVMDPASGEVAVMVFLSRSTLASSRKGVGQRVRDFARMVVELPKRYRLEPRLGSGLGGVGIKKVGGGEGGNGKPTISPLDASQTKPATVGYEGVITHGKEQVHFKVENVEGNDVTVRISGDFSGGTKGSINALLSQHMGGKVVKPIYDAKPRIELQEAIAGEGASFTYEGKEIPYRISVRPEAHGKNINLIVNVKIQSGVLNRDAVMQAFLELLVMPPTKEGDVVAQTRVEDVTFSFPKAAVVDRDAGDYRSTFLPGHFERPIADVHYMGKQGIVSIKHSYNPSNGDIRIVAVKVEGHVRLRNPVVRRALLEKYGKDVQVVFDVKDPRKAPKSAKSVVDVNDIIVQAGEQYNGILADQPGWNTPRGRLATLKTLMRAQRATAGKAGMLRRHPEYDALLERAIREVDADVVAGRTEWSPHADVVPEGYRLPADPALRAKIEFLAGKRGRAADEFDAGRPLDPSSEKHRSMMSIYHREGGHLKGQTIFADANQLGQFAESLSKHARADAQSYRGADVIDKRFDGLVILDRKSWLQFGHDSATRDDAFVARQFDSPQGRVYFAVNYKYAKRFWTELSKLAHGEYKDLHLIFKMAKDMKRYSTGDSAVLYFRGKDSTRVLKLVRTLQQRLPGLALKDTKPVMAAQLNGANGRPMKGVSFGQSPKNGDSFNGRIAKVAAAARRAFRAREHVRVAQGGEPLSDAAYQKGVRRAIGHALEKSGISLDHTAFEGGKGVEAFKPIYKASDQAPRGPRGPNGQTDGGRTRSSRTEFQPRRDAEVGITEHPNGVLDGPSVYNGQSVFSRGQWGHLKMDHALNPRQCLEPANLHVVREYGRVVDVMKLDLHDGTTLYHYMRGDSVILVPKSRVRSNSEWYYGRTNDINATGSNEAARTFMRDEVPLNGGAREYGWKVKMNVDGSIGYSRVLVGGRKSVMWPNSERDAVRGRESELFYSVAHSHPKAELAPSPQDISFHVDRAMIAAARFKGQQVPESVIHHEGWYFHFVTARDVEGVAAIAVKPNAVGKIAQVRIYYMESPATAHETRGTGRRIAAHLDKALIGRSDVLIEGRSHNAVKRIAWEHRHNHPVFKRFYGGDIQAPTGRAPARMSYASPARGAQRGYAVTAVGKSGSVRPHSAVPPKTVEDVMQRLRTAKIVHFKSDTDSGDTIGRFVGENEGAIRRAVLSDKGLLAQALKQAQQGYREVRGQEGDNADRWVIQASTWDLSIDPRFKIVLMLDTSFREIRLEIKTRVYSDGHGRVHARYLSVFSEADLRSGLRPSELFDVAGNEPLKLDKTAFVNRSRGDLEPKIAPVVTAMLEFGIRTTYSCEGHPVETGQQVRPSVSIDLKDLPIVVTLLRTLDPKHAQHVRLDFRKGSDDFRLTTSKDIPLARRQEVMVAFARHMRAKAAELKGPKGPPSGSSGTPSPTGGQGGNSPTRIAKPVGPVAQTIFDGALALQPKKAVAPVVEPGHHHLRPPQPVQRVAAQDATGQLWLASNFALSHRVRESGQYALDPLSKAQVFFRKDKTTNRWTVLSTAGFMRRLRRLPSGRVEETYLSVFDKSKTLSLTYGDVIVVGELRITIKAKQ